MAGYVPREVKDMAKGLPKKIPEKVLEWRAKQKEGSIMKTETFKKIEKGAVKDVGKERAKKIAGASYWKSVFAKYKERKK
jgi:hypothetical protein